VWRHAENDETNSGTMNTEKGHPKRHHLLLTERLNYLFELAYS
jgi:hypothetical protein